MRRRERLLVALLLVSLAQVAVQRRVLRAEVLHRALGLGLEIGLAAVDEIEAARDLARDLDVRDLVLADGHVHRPVQQDVGALQQRVAEEAVGREVLLLQLLLLVLVGRHALEPAERRDHRQQQVQLGVLGHPRLDEQRRHGRIEPGGQPVDDHLPGVVLELAGVVVAGRERVVVRDEEVAVVLVLQLGPVLERAVVIAEVQGTGRPHPGQHAPRGGDGRTQERILRRNDEFKALIFIYLQNKCQSAWSFRNPRPRETKTGLYAGEPDAAVIRTR